MKLVLNTQNLSYSEGKIMYRGENLIDSDGFLGLCTGNPQSGLKLPSILNSSNNFDINLSRAFINQMRDFIDRIMDSIQGSSDYVETSTGFELRHGTWLKYPLMYSDEYVEKVTIFTNLYPEVDKSTDLNVFMAGDVPGSNVTSVSIVKKFDKNWNIVSYVTMSELDYLVKYARYSMNGSYIGSGLTSGHANPVISIPQVENELRTITNVTLKYI